MRSAAEPRAVPGSATGDGGRRRSYRTILAVAACVAAVAALSIFLAVHDSKRSSGPAAAGLLPGVTWQGAEPILTVVFTDDTARIFDGCSNRLREVTIGDGVMDMGKLIAPASVCAGTHGVPDPALDTFDAVVLFGHHLTWQRNGDTLLLADNDGQSVDLHLAGAALSVTDQEWVLERFNDAHSESHEGDYGLARLLIGRDGTVDASDLCSGLAGTARVTDSTITFSGMHTTARYCTVPTSPSVSEVVDQVLSGDVTYEIRGDELIIDGDGRGLLIYTSAG